MKRERTSKNKNSSINETLKLCSLAAFLGLFLITFLLTYNNPQTLPEQQTLKLLSFSSSSPSSSPAATASKSNTSASQTTYINISATSSVDGVSTATISTPSEDDDVVSSMEDKLFSSLSTESQTKYINTSGSAVVSFQSVNSSASPPDYDPTRSTGAAPTPMAGEVEYEIPSGEINNDNNNSSMLKELQTSSDAGPTPSSTGEGKRKCKMYEGRWVYKPDVEPRYHVNQCYFLEDKMSCRKNGRPDFKYEGWSWESDGCQIPIFNGTDMLDRLRGKRMIIAGDSLNRNQWESLACLLYTCILPERAFVDADGPAYKVLKAKDYDFTLEFYWAPFLVHLDETHKSGKKVLSLDKVVPSSEQWRGADVMVFNSGHWWTHGGKLRAWDVFEYGGEQVEEMETEVAYERALTTWAQWMAHNIDPAKTKVYFRSISPEHQKQWCFNHTRPMAEDEPYIQVYPRSMVDVAERKIMEINGQDGIMGVGYLNITGMSSTRIDGHPSIYRFKHWKVITEKYRRFLKSRSDCSHWCLPGLPDTWNRILYASMFFDHLSPGDFSITS